MLAITLKLFVCAVIVKIKKCLVQLTCPKRSFVAENDFVPRHGDRVTFNLCPMPPKFQKFQVKKAAPKFDLEDFLKPLSHGTWQVRPLCGVNTVH
jgi:hypothetical protein